jgi:hypothetical protein
MHTPAAELHYLPDRPTVAGGPSDQNGVTAKLAKLAVAPITLPHANATAAAALEQTKEGNKPYLLKAERYDFRTGS